MANVIDILINAKSNATAEFAKATGSLAQFTTAAGLAGAAGALAGTAIVTAMQNAQQAIIGTTLRMSDNVEMLDRMSNYTGISVQRLDLFRQQLEDDGLSADQLSVALRYLREQLNSGDKTLAKYGVTSNDAFTALQQMSAAMQNAKTVGERAAIATAGFGLRNAETAASILLVARNIDTKMVEALRNGTLQTDEYLKKMRELGDTMNEFAKTKKSFDMQTATFWAPYIEGATKLLTVLNQVMTVKRAADRVMFAQLYGGKPVSYHGAGRSWESAATGGGAPPPPPPKPVIDPLTEKITALVKALENYSGSSLSGLRSALSGGASAGVDGKTVSDSIEKPLDRIHAAALRFGQSIEGAFRNAFTSILTITSSSTNLITQMFASLANGILQTVADMLAQAAAKGLIDLALSFLPGGGITSKIGSLATNVATSTRMTQGGGNVYNISSFNSRDTLDDLLNPTGSFRRAGDRMRDLAIANAG